MLAYRICKVGPYQNLVRFEGVVIRNQQRPVARDREHRLSHPISPLPRQTGGSKRKRPRDHVATSTEADYATPTTDGNHATSLARRRLSLSVPPTRLRVTNTTTQGLLDANNPHRRQQQSPAVIAQDSALGSSLISTGNNRHEGEGSNAINRTDASLTVWTVDALFYQPESPSDVITTANSPPLAPPSVPPQPTLQPPECTP